MSAGDFRLYIRFIFYIFQIILLRYRPFWRYQVPNETLTHDGLLDSWTLRLPTTSENPNSKTFIFFFIFTRIPNSVTLSTKPDFRLKLVETFAPISSNLSLYTTYSKIVDSDSAWFYFEEDEIFFLFYLIPTLADVNRKCLPRKLSFPER